MPSEIIARHISAQGSTKGFSNRPRRGAWRNATHLSICVAINQQDL
jgi:hypothetical protein